MAAIGEVFKPGDKVPNSGIYRVLHDYKHNREHEVTCVAHTTFPPCNKCGHHPRFELVRKAIHIDVDDDF
jgi:hypothetical protein